MTATKNKLKNGPVGAIRHWWNLMLFARGFEFEVESPSNRVAAALQSVDIPDDPLWEDRVGEVRVEADDDAHTFDLKVNRVQNPITYTSVRATGRIVYSAGYGTSIVRGHVRLGWAYYVLLIAILAFASGNWIDLIQRLPVPGLLMGLFTVAMVGLSIWQIRADYRLLIQRLVEAVSDGAVQSLDDLTDEADDSPFDHEAEHMYSQARTAHD